MNHEIDEFYGADKPGPERPQKEVDPATEKAMRVVARTWDAYIRARDNGHTDYMKMAKRCDEFYIGKQWKDEDKKELEAVGRPALTINKILPTVNTVLGEQSMKRANVQFKPARNGNEQTAAALTKLFIYISNLNDLDWKEGLVFADGIIQERGFYDVRMSFEDNVIEGEIDIQVKDPLDIIIDPDAKEYDPSTWREVFETRWMSLEEISDVYGKEHAKRVHAELSGIDRLDNDAIQLHSPAFGGKAAEFGPVSLNGEERYIRSIRVISRQWVKYKNCRIYVDPEFGDTSEVPPTWSDEKANLFAEEMGLILTSQVKRKIRWTTIASDKVLLEDKWSPYKDFTIVPYFPFFRRGNPFGLVRNLLDPQEQFNKVESQTLHIVNTTANSGYIVEEGALVNMTPDDLREEGAQTGIVITTAPGRKDGIEKIKPNQIPTGLDRIGQKIENNIKEISSVNDARLGTESAEVSGVALENKQDRGQVQTQTPLDHLAKTRQLLAGKILDLIQQFISEERVFRITSPVMAPDQEDEMIIVNHMNAAGEIINDLHVGKYSVVVTTMPSRDTYAETQFAQALQMRGAGILIPDDVVVQFSDLQGRQELAERIRRLTGQADPTPEEVEIAQIQQQIALQTQQRELDKLGAEIEELMARAAKQRADAGSKDSESERQLDKLEAEIQAKREEYNLRNRLAELAAGSKERIAGLNAEKDIIKEQLKLSHSQQKAARESVPQQ